MSRTFHSQRRDALALTAALAQCGRDTGVALRPTVQSVSTLRKQSRTLRTARQTRRVRSF